MLYLGLTLVLISLWRLCSLLLLRLRLRPASLWLSREGLSLVTLIEWSPSLQAVCFCPFPEEESQVLSLPEFLSLYKYRGRVSPT